MAKHNRGVVQSDHKAKTRSLSLTRG